jgi:lipopolysaccharide/colanic/teichoic acid biosynthesis glycosyltransferase
MNPRAIRHLILAGDLGWIVVSAIAAYMFRTDAPWDAGHLQISFRASLFLIAIALVAWCIIFERLKLDGFYGGYQLPTMFSKLFTGVLCLVVLLASAGFLLHHDGSRLLLFAFAALLLGGALAGRLAARGLARKFAGRGRRHRVLILGAGKVAQELAARIQQHPEMRWELIGFLFPSACDFVDLTLQAEQNSQLNSLEIDSLLRNKCVDEVVLTAPVPDQGEVLNLVANCRRRNIRVSVVPSHYQLYVNRPVLVDVDGLPLLRLGEGELTLFQAILKRTVDLILSSVLLMAASPLLLSGMLWLRMRKRHALMSDLRCGKEGHEFRMYRLNSQRGALRLSWFERLLQMLSITELPQLWNVIRGDMSLVGPRPESHERVKRYSDWQRQRLSCKPGVTGLAQVHGLREESASEEKAYYDLRYIQDWSFLTDFSLILQTMWTIPQRFFSTAGSAGPALAPNLADRPNEFAELVHADRS